MTEITITTGNVRGLFSALEEYADNAAQALARGIDFDIYWPMSDEGKAAWDEALRLNTHPDRVLSIGDARTRGGKFYNKAMREARQKWV